MSFVLPDGVILYNDYSTNHLLSNHDVITRISPPMAAKHVDRAFVYDPYTCTMWIVGPTGQLYNSNGRELTFKGYQEHQAACCALFNSSQGLDILRADIAAEDEMSGFESDHYEFTPGPARGYQPTEWQEAPKHDNVLRKAKILKMMQRYRDLEVRSDLQVKSYCSKAE